MSKHKRIMRFEPKKAFDQIIKERKIRVAPSVCCTPKMVSVEKK
jgi:hypothetical protein